MDNYYVFLYDLTKYGESKKAIIRDKSSVLNIHGNYKPVNGKVVIRSIFNYSKKGYKFTTEFEKLF